jgi:hypothetical protein
LDENPFRYQKNLDLHESEWRHEKKKEPFFGPNAKWFAFYFFGALILTPIVHYFVSAAVEAVLQ